jgi:hypothetical protein
VPGLRREEVAELAGVSIDYYIQLERGRSTGVSEAVLDAVARALLLNSAEREHLFNLTKPNRTTRKPPQRNAQKVRPSLLQLVDAMDSTVPAMIQGRRTDVLAINRLARWTAGSCRSGLAEIGARPGAAAAVSGGASAARRRLRLAGPP